MLKVILAAIDVESGEDVEPSYEYHNFFLPLRKVIDSLIPFDYMGVMRSHGRRGMNRALLSLVKQERPELLILVLATDQFIPEVIDEINNYTITLGYLFDDMWRTKYSQFWANHFSYVTTSDVNGVARFRDAGFQNVIYSPFGCNPQSYPKKDVPKIYDVTFVGQHHPYRAWCLRKLKRAGLKVHVWGSGWESGKVSHEQMVDIFNQSKININLSNCESMDIRYLASCFDRSLRETLMMLRHTRNALFRQDSKTKEQVKGRHFEIGSCGGFQLSYFVEGLERHFLIGEEIALYDSVDEMIEKADYYLKHEDERREIAEKGYLRTIHHHSMEQRFREIFLHLGLQSLD